MPTTPTLLSFAGPARVRAAFDRAVADLRSVHAGTVVALVGAETPVDPVTVARRTLAAGARRLVVIADRADWDARATLETGADAALLLRPGAAPEDDAATVRGLLLATGAWCRVEPSRRTVLAPLRPLPTLRSLIHLSSLPARRADRF